MFGFGFDGPDAIFETRGDQHRTFADFSKHLLRFKSSEIRSSFTAHRRPRR